MEQIKKVLTSKQAKRLYWNTLAGFLGLFLVYLTDLDWIYAPIAIAVVNGLTKEINTRLSE